MRETNSVFGGEVTGHYYFRDFYYCDNGFIPALLILELMSRKNQTLAQLLEPLRQKYFISGEINTRVADMSLVQGQDRRTRREVQGRQRLHDGRRVGRVSRPGTSTCARRTPSR